MKNNRVSIQPTKLVQPHRCGITNFVKELNESSSSEDANLYTRTTGVIRPLQPLGHLSAKVQLEV